ncbi:reverse transcriptase, partial [Tanacetum coccineum]
MQAREDFLQVAKFHLKRAQDRLISQANKHRSDRVLEVGMRLAKVNNKATAYVLVKWSNHTDEDATWENYADLIQ